MALRVLAILANTLTLSCRATVTVRVPRMFQLGDRAAVATPVL